MADAMCFIEEAKRATRMGDLTGLLADVVRELGFNHVTLAHHVDPEHAPRSAVAFSNYPEAWMNRILSRRYFSDDPVLVASERSAAPILWSEVPRRLKLTARQTEILRLADEFGLAEGLTIPINVPGEFHGSCSFGVRKGRPMPGEGRFAALWVGAFAFESARRIVGLVRPSAERPRLTPRQFDCLVLVGKGKSDWTIAQLLGISRETVHEHLEAAKRRYGVATRPQLVASCLADGQITYADLLG